MEGLDDSSIAENQFCRNHGLKHKNVFGPKVAEKHQYQLLHCPTGIPTALLIPIFYRFGNAFIQIIKSLHVAKNIGATEIYLPDSPFWNFLLLESNSPIRFRPISEHAGVRPPTLQGRFYRSDWIEPLLRGFSPSKAAAQIDELFKGFADFLGAGPVPPAKSLVIHFRSGDIFQKKTPHLLYTQPPLAFYQICIDHHQQSFPGSAICLVFEDRRNPCVDAVEKYARQKNLHVIAQRGSLQEDLLFLLRSENFVLSTGTFTPTIAILSPSIRACYRFSSSRDSVHENFEFLAALVKAAGINNFSVSDPEGHYVGVGEWRNDDAQRDLMISLPREFLTPVTAIHAV